MKEVRLLSGVSIRCSCGSSAKQMRVSGMAARYETPTTIGDPVRGNGRSAYREVIARGAFAKAVRDKHDARLYLNHNHDIILGRVSAGTLRLRDTGDGLAFEADLPDTEAGRATYGAIQRGDLNECSFGFENPVDKWSVESVDGQRMGYRRISDVGHLADVSIVANPAYPGTSVHARTGASQLELRSIEIPEFVLDELEPERDGAQERRKKLLHAILL